MDLFSELQNAGYTGSSGSDGESDRPIPEPGPGACVSTSSGEEAKMGHDEAIFRSRAESEPRQYNVLAASEAKDEKRELGGTPAATLLRIHPHVSADGETIEVEMTTHMLATGAETAGRQADTLMQLLGHQYITTEREVQTWTMRPVYEWTFGEKKRVGQGADETDEAWQEWWYERGSGPIPGWEGPSTPRRLGSGRHRAPYWGRESQEEDGEESWTRMDGVVEMGKTTWTAEGVRSAGWAVPLLLWDTVLRHQAVIGPRLMVEWVASRHHNAGLAEVWVHVYVQGRYGDGHAGVSRVPAMYKFDHHDGVGFVMQDGHAPSPLYVRLAEGDDGWGTVRMRTGEGGEDESEVDFSVAAAWDGRRDDELDVRFGDAFDVLHVPNPDPDLQQGPWLVVAQGSVAAGGQG